MIAISTAQVFDEKPAILMRIFEAQNIRWKFLGSNVR